MGIFSKIGKGIGNVFKKIGKGIKTGLKSVGKVVNKLGIIGQIGLMFILPGIGGLLSKGFGALTSGLLNVAGSGIGAGLARGVGHILSYAGKFASTAGKVFKTVTDGISGFIGKVGGEVLNKVGFKGFGTGDGISSAFRSWVDDVATDFSSSFDAWGVSNSTFASNLGKGLPSGTAAKGARYDESALDSIVTDPANSAIDSKLGSAHASDVINNEFVAGVKAPETTTWFGDLQDDVIKKFKGIPKTLASNAINGALQPEQEEFDLKAQVQPQYSYVNPVEAAPTLASMGYNYGAANAPEFIGSNFDPSSYNTYNNFLSTSLGRAS